MKPRKPLDYRGRTCDGLIKKLPQACYLKSRVFMYKCIGLPQYEFNVLIQICL